MITQRTRSFTTLLFSVGFLLVFPFAWEGLDAQTRYAGAMLYGLTGLLWLVLRLRSPHPFSLPRLAWPFLALLGLSLALVTVSPVALSGFLWWLNGQVVFVLFLFFVDSFRLGWKVRTWEIALISVGLFFSLWNVLELVMWHLRWYFVSGEIFSSPPVNYRSAGLSFWHANTLGGFFSLILPLVWVRLLRARTTRRRILWGVVFALFSLTLYNASSRGSWIGVALGIGLTSLMIYWPKLAAALNGSAFRRNRNVPENSEGRWSGGVVRHTRSILVGLLVLALVTAIGYLLVRQVQLTQHGTPSERILIWSVAARLIGLSPVWGHGLGSFTIEYGLQTAGVPAFPFVHAHNAVLQVGAEMGILGLLILGWLVWFIVRAFLSAWQAGKGTRRRYLLAAYAGAGIAFAAHQMVDFLVGQMSYALTMVLILALVLRLAPASQYERFPKKWSIPIIILLMGMSFIGIWFTFSGLDFYSQGLASARNEDWLEARGKICQSASTDPGNPLYTFQCALSNAFLAAQTGDVQALEQALVYQRQGLALDPYWPPNWANLASYEWQTGETQNALAHMRRLVKTAPRNSSYQLNLGWMEEAMGNTQAAKSAYAQAVCLNPWLRVSPHMQETALRREVARQPCLQDMRSVAEWQTNQYLFEGYQAWKDGDPAEAERKFHLSIQSHPYNSAAYAYLGLLQQEDGRPTEAWRSVKTGLFLNDENLRALAVAAQVALAQGKSQEALAYLAKFMDLYRAQKVPGLYYILLYRQDSLPADISPFLQRSINEDILSSFTRLAEHLAQTGDFERQAQVLAWMAELGRP